MIVLDLGSSDKEEWYEDSENSFVYHFDTESFEGVIPWTAPNVLPIKNQSVDKVYLGRLLIYLKQEDYVVFAEEINRVLKRDGEIIIHDIGGVLEFPIFFHKLESLRWFRIKEELVNLIDEPDYVYTSYLISIKRFEKRG